MSCNKYILGGKKSFRLWIVLTIFIFQKQTWAQQVPSGFTYQAIVRDGVGLPVVNAPATIRLSILQGSPSGTIVWQERHSTVTNQFGLVNLVVGSGLREAGTASAFSDINWASAQTFIRVELVQGSSTINLGTVPFQSVPYALAAENALRIQNVRVSASTPLNGQFLVYNSISGSWEPQNLAGANGGTVTTVKGIGPIQILGNGGIDPSVSILQSSDTQDGYLSSLDWISFNNKISPATLITTPGDLLGSFADGFTVVGLQGRPLSNVPPASGDVLQWNGTQWAPQPVVGAVSSVTSDFPIIISGTPSIPHIAVATVTNTTDGVLTAADYVSFLAKLGPTSAFGGDVTGTYQSLTVGSIAGIPFLPTGATVGQTLVFNGTAFVPQNMAGATPTTFTGTDGLLISGSGFDYTFSGANFLQATQTVSGVLSGNILAPSLANASVGIPQLQTGILTSIIGLGGIGVVQNGQAFSISGSGMGIQYGTSTTGFRELLVKNSDNTVTTTGIGIESERLVLNANDILFSIGSDLNHGLGLYNASKLYFGQNINGPVLYGNGGGALAINNAGVPQRIVLNWNNNGQVGINTNTIGDVTATLDVHGNVRVRNLTVPGAFVTVDGLGNLGVGTMPTLSASTFTSTAAGTSFTFDNIGIGTSTVGGAKLKVAGDISGNGLVIASSALNNPTGTASTTFKTLFRQRIYIPHGTSTLDGSINTYKFLAAGTGTLQIIIGTQVVTVTASTDDPTASELIPTINVSTMAGTFQTLEIRGRADASAEGILVHGYVLKAKD